MAVSGGQDNLVKIWSTDTGVCIKTLGRESVTAHADWVTCCAWHPEEELLLSGSVDGTLKLWEMFTGQLVQTLHGHEVPVWACGFSPDGFQVVSGGGALGKDGNTARPRLAVRWSCLSRCLACSQTSPLLLPCVRVIEKCSSQNTSLTRRSDRR